jgi:hypothetical protein
LNIADKTDSLKQLEMARVWTKTSKNGLFGRNGDKVWLGYCQALV